MLQRFRGSKDFRAVDKYKPKADQDELQEIKQKESDWWKNNA